MNENAELLPRALRDSVSRIARVMPVVVIGGARQSGKSTLVRELLPDSRAYYSLDDLDVRAQAERAPDDLLERGDELVLDEVQKVPQLLAAVKRAVDRDRRAGRFILTGSANLLLMQRVSESLAGRAGYLTLWPMTHRELRGFGRAGRWSDLFEQPFETWSRLLEEDAESQRSWRDAVARGGYPVPAVELRDAEDRRIWLDGYVRTYLERDLQDLSSIDNLVDFRRLMRAVCLRLGNVLNQSELGRDIALPQPTVRRWLNLLETSYQLVRLPCYAINRTKRLIKSPKIYWCDTALAHRLAGEPELNGAYLENQVLSDLLVWRDAHASDHPGLFYWRTTRGEEVDLVIEHRSQVIAVEVKSATRVNARDAIHLATFRDEYGPSVRGCLLLHCGTRIERLGRGIIAAPWWCVV
jgi:uncharacterized protein